jgi:hypothetical protein
MAVSANTLFHFTKLKGLEGILSSKGFYCQYSDEHFENILPQKNPYRSTYIPMISFCDLTITQLSKDSVHTEYFGSYGIGLTKEWGIKNRISPVMYVHRRSQAARQFPELGKVVSQMSKDFQRKGGDYITFSKIDSELVDSLKYIKPYKGHWHKGKIKKGKPVIYYNEREWRYCPLLKELAVLSAVIKDNKEEKVKLNRTLKENLVTFTPKDIKFILIKNKKDIPAITKVIREKMNILSVEMDELATKIITFEEIKEDF